MTENGIDKRSDFGSFHTDMADRSAKIPDVIVPYCPVEWKHLITNPIFSPQLPGEEGPYWRGFSAMMR